MQNTIQTSYPINKYPQFIMGVLAQAKNGDKQFWKQKFHAVNGKAQHALKLPWFIFLLSFFLGGGEIFFIFPVFSICSLQVPNGFPSGSQYVPQGCSQWHLALIPY